jgi:hypothetical protein
MNLKKNLAIKNVNKGPALTVNDNPFQWKNYEEIYLHSYPPDFMMTMQPVDIRASGSSCQSSVLHSLQTAFSLSKKKQENRSTPYPNL